MWLTFIKDVAIVIGGVVALLTFINGILEYTRQGRRSGSSSL